MQKETHTRSIIKGISWRIFASIITMILVYFFTGNLTVVAEIGVLEVILKVIFYYIHERSWEIIKWGRKTI